MVYDVIIREALAPVQFFRLKHPKADINDLVIHSSNRYKAEAVLRRYSIQRILYVLSGSLAVILY